MVRLALVCFVALALGTSAVLAEDSQRRDALAYLTDRALDRLTQTEFSTLSIFNEKAPHFTKPRIHTLAAHGNAKCAFFAPDASSFAALDPATLPDDEFKLNSSKQELALQELLLELGKLKDDRSVSFRVVVLDANMRKNTRMGRYMMPKLEKLGADLVASGPVKTPMIKGEDGLDVILPLNTTNGFIHALNMLTGTWKGVGASTGPSDAGKPIYDLWRTMHETMEFSEIHNVYGTLDTTDAYLVQYKDIIYRDDTGALFHLETGFLSMALRGETGNSTEFVKMFAMPRGVSMVVAGREEPDSGMGNMYHLTYRGTSEGPASDVVVWDESFFIDYSYSLRFNSSHFDYRQQMIFHERSDKPKTQRRVLEHFNFSSLRKVKQ